MTLGTLGVIKLNGKDVAGTLEMLADNFGTISGGAVVTGPVTLAKGAGNAFAGSASFGSVDGPSGRIRVINSADVTGSLTIHGDVDGPGVSILVSGDINGGTISIGSLIASGTVEVQGSITNGTVKTTGDMAGAITVAGDLGSGGKIWIMGDASGDVSIGSDALGDVQIDGDLTSLGSVTVDGALAAAGLAGAGRILVSGMCDGDIAIGKQTDNLTLIHLLGGLDDNAAVEINTSGGVFDAAGDINVGPATPPDPLNDITFDGCIRIHSDGQTPPGGGDLRGGSITVIGCHETSAELNICLDGGDGGEGIDIQQTACFLKADGWSCGTCPP